MAKSGDPRIDIVGDAIYTHPLAKGLTEHQCWELAQEAVWALENNAYEITQPEST